jgi:diadenosine tetraphosphate (Ap4A) HIT family hydrolase
MTEKVCAFCSLPNERIVNSNLFGIVIRDGFPISEGHTLIIPKRHIKSFFDLQSKERDSLFDLVEQEKSYLTDSYSPDGFNIGINDGPAAGQTISHLHIHLIPRYTGDLLDPRGGVRWIIPSKAKYWD